MINSKFNSLFINLLLSKDVSGSGKISFFKLKEFSISLYKIISSGYRFKPQICYFALSSTGFAFYRDCILIFFLRIFKVKIVFHLHNKGVSSFSRIYFNKILYKYVFYNSKVILLSDLLFPDIQELVSCNNVFICPNGLPDLQNKSDFPQNQIVVNFLFLSNLIESKGVFDLLNACKILHSKGYTFNCTIIGSDGDLSSCDINETIDSYGLLGIVNCLGPKFHSEKNIYFSNADIFIFPTFYSNECMPLVLIEAMQYSLPIITTFEGGIPDLVIDGKTGFLVPQRDVKSLVARMQILIDSPQLRLEMGKAGRNNYENKFTNQIFETRLCEILFDLSAP